MDSPIVWTHRNLEGDGRDVQTNHNPCEVADSVRGAVSKRQNLVTQLWAGPQAMPVALDERAPQHSELGAAFSFRTVKGASRIDSDARWVSTRLPLPHTRCISGAISTPNHHPTRQQRRASNPHMVKRRKTCRNPRNLRYPRKPC